MRRNITQYANASLKYYIRYMREKESKEIISKGLENVQRRLDQIEIKINGSESRFQDGLSQLNAKIQESESRFQNRLDKTESSLKEMIYKTDDKVQSVQNELHTLTRSINSMSWRIMIMICGLFAAPFAKEMFIDESSKA